MKQSARTKSRNLPGAVTITDVAAEARVSTATVSRVLAGMQGVKREARDRVNEAVAKLNYHPNSLARGLRMGQRKVVGVIIPDLRNPFFTGIAHGVEAALSGEGYTLLLGNSDGQPERELVQLGILRSEGVAGLVFIAGNRPAAAAEVIRRWGIPVVAVDRSLGGVEVDFVSSNNRQAIRQAVDHFLSLGQREIAFVTGPRGINVAEERLDGYCDALRSAGIALRDSYIVYSDFRTEGGYASMVRLLDLPKPPKAVVVANNLMTLGALQAIHERGVRVPEELALIGFDDIPWAAYVRTPLTAVAQQTEELGRVAAKLLLERLRDPQSVVRQVVLPTRLVVRASCGAPPTNPAARLAALPGRNSEGAGEPLIPESNANTTTARKRSRVESGAGD